MPYQYLCPCCRQQWLEGHETSAGAQVQCPTCQQVFVQPPPEYAAAGQAAGGMPNPMGGMGPGGIPNPMGSGMGMPGMMPGGYPGQPGPGMMPGQMMPGQMGMMPGQMMPGGMPNPMGSGMGMPGGMPNPMGSGLGMMPGGDMGMGYGGMDPSLDPLVHAPCPACRQVIPANKSLMGQNVACPYCQQVVVLHYEDTQEFKIEREAYLARKGEQTAAKLLNWAIGAAIVLGLGVFTMIIVSMLDDPAEQHRLKNQKPPVDPAWTAPIGSGAKSGAAPAATSAGTAK